VDSIALGFDFREAVERSLSSCGVFLVIIGPQWLNIKVPNDESGRRRLDDPTDLVRQEIATGLKKGSSLPVIPVLVRGATMPTADQLPDDLKSLAFRNSLVLSHLDWEGTVQKLANAIRPHVGEHKDREQAATPAVSSDGAAARVAPETRSAPRVEDPVWDRLEDQIKWYEFKSARYQKLYKQIKIVEYIAIHCHNRHSVPFST
jgi:hypothetical protein